MLSCASRYCTGYLERVCVDAEIKKCTASHRYVVTEGVQSDSRILIAMLFYSSAG